MKGLTKKQRSILSFIQSYIQQYNYSPSYREIMQHFSYASLNTVHKHIQSLKKKGVLDSETKSSRSLQPLEATSKPLLSTEITLPFIGKISSLHLIETFMHSQSITVPQILVTHPDSTYVLQVEGDFLLSECIADGDLLLVEARQEPQAGEIIIGDVQYKILVKKYYPEGQYIRLEGYHHEPLILRAENIKIHGILVGLIRSY